MGSPRKSLTKATIMTNNTTLNGSADRMVRFCRPDRTSSPPVSSMTTAMPIIHKPQKTTSSLFGAGLPLEDMVPMTTDAESAGVMKKMAGAKGKRKGGMGQGGGC